MHKKWIALLLIAAMILSLCACKGTEPDETTQPTTESTAATTTETEPTTQPEPTAHELFAQAKDALLAADVLTLDITAEKTTDLRGNSYSRKETATATYEGLQGELLAKIEGKLTFEDKAYDAEHEYTEQYLSGVTYATFGTGKHKEETTAEDYLARQIPLCLFNAESFAEGEISQAGNATVLKFSAPSALEGWIVGEEGTLVSAEATAKIENGIFTEMSYTASYERGPGEISVSYQTKLQSGGEKSLSAEAPADADQYCLLSDVEAPRIYEEACFNMDVTSTLSGNLNQVISSQAAGYVVQMSTNLYEYGEGASYMAKMESDIMQISSEGQQSAETEEIFRDGKYSYYMDGELVNEGKLDVKTYQNAIYSIYTEYLASGEWFTGAELHDLGDGYLLEFSSENEECRDYFKDLTMSEIFGDNTILDDSASAYKHTVLKGYMGIDKDTFMPLSYNLEFTGVHTIEGTDCELSQQFTLGLTPADPEAYHEITDETLPDAEPAEKASPVFYHVTGRDGSEMWLLGTIHIGDERTAFLPQEIYTAFDASDALAVEFDMNAAVEAMDEDEAFVEKIATMMIYSDGSTVKDHLNPELYDRAVKYMKFAGQYIPTIEYMKVAAWQNTLDSIMLAGHKSLNSDMGVDQRLLDRAEEADKEILNVESMEAQVQMLMGFSPELQEYLLKSTLDTPRYEYLREADELYEMWCAGNEEELRQYITSEYDDVPEEEQALAKEYEDAISTSRNIKMIDTAKGYLSSGKTVFYAVGLAHLLAENGLVDGLRAAGYTVELVSYAG